MNRRTLCQYQILEKKSFNPHIIPKTKGLEERVINHRVTDMLQKLN